MTSRLCLLALHLALVWPALLHAQTASGRPAGSGDAAAADPDRMYEDIEIFRRILDRKLQPLYPRAGHGHHTGGMTGGLARGMSYAIPMGSHGTTSYAIPMGSQDGMQPLQAATYLGQPGATGLWQAAETATPTLEGVYLEGRGVVYTATLASLHPATRSEAVRAVSDWERARREVRHEKDEPKKGETGRPELSDVLVQALAENGHHFSQLAEGESLTIVVTVHAPAASKSAGGSSRGQQNPAGGGDAGKVSDLQLLGDLHQKQVRYQEAIKAFERALDLKPDANEVPTLYRKLAQCYLALGEDEKARAALERLRVYLKEPSDGREKTAQAGKRSAALPVKLIVSAPKKLLDQVGEGKMKLEDFRRQVSVKTLTFGERQPHD